MKAPSRAGAGHRMGRSGFTLIEVMVAVAIVGTAVVATLAAYGAELRALTRAGEVSTATALADDRLTTLALLGAHDLPRLPDSLRDGRFPAPFAAYSWAAETRRLPGHDLVEVTLVVTWSTGSHDVTTLLPAPGFRGAAR